jgi:copper chaperone CopZ
MSETTTTYRVSGMTCAHCVNAVTEEVGSLPHVTDVQVELATGDVTVRSTRPLTDDEVSAAIDEAGYHLAS